MLKPISCIVAICTLIAGCSPTLPTISSDDDGVYKAKYPFGTISTESGAPRASFIQWNADYAVTARHAGYMSASVFTCDGNCDLQFIRHSATGRITPWREGVADETIIHIGINAHGDTVVTSGKNIDLPVTFGGAVGFPYRTSSAISIPGMSGGPVYAVDGHVVGMTIGNFKADAGRESIYVPYSTILTQWNHFQKAMANTSSDAYN